MKINLSICIPTMNRPDYLLTALISIFNQRKVDMSVEICISNNASEKDYTRVEKLINNGNTNDISINYYIQEDRIPLDEHMHYVYRMAKGEYIYYLGDDDYFHDDAFIVLTDLIKNQNVDLSIFNGDVVDSEGVILGTSFKETKRVYNKVIEAFLDLKGKSTFGAVLVKRKYITDVYFEGLYDGCHAYTCFWVTMLNQMDTKYNITVPEHPVVFLRRAEKYYNLVHVYYESIPIHICKFKALIETDTFLPIIESYYKTVIKKNNSITFKSSIYRKGIKYSELPSNSIKEKLKNLVAYIISFPVVYDNLLILKGAIRNFKTNL